MWSAFNDTKGTTVVNSVREATSVWARFWGLMGRASLPDDGGLLLRPCSSVHTFFMRFPIDVIFVDQGGSVVKIIAAMKPWRAALGGPGAHSALELNSGAAANRGLEVGDVLTLKEP